MLFVNIFALVLIFTPIFYVGIHPSHKLASKVRCFTGCVLSAYITFLLSWGYWDYLLRIETKQRLLRDEFILKLHDLSQTDQNTELKTLLNQYVEESTGKIVGFSSNTKFPP